MTRTRRLTVAAFVGATSLLVAGFGAETSPQARPVDRLELSRDVGCQVPNMSQHLAVLRRAGLVTSRRDGNTILYRLTDHKVLEAYRLIQDIAR